MGNSSSKDDRVGGGIMIGAGIILGFTPLAPFTSSWMIPLGADMAGKSVSPVGISISYSDDNNGIMYHIGNPDNVQYERELNHSKILEHNKNLIIVFNKKRDDALKILHTNIYTSSLNNKISIFTFDENKIIDYTFYKYIHTNILSLLPESNEYVDTIYVARRRLSVLPFYVGYFAHSGLVLKTNTKKMFILEYGVKDGGVSCNRYTDNFQGYNWQIQNKGTKLQKRVSINDLTKMMRSNTGKTMYNMLLFNCHMAQEKVRRDLGLHVDNPYLIDELVLEYGFINMLRND